MSLHSPLMIRALVLVGVAAVLTLLVDPQAGGRAVIPVIVVQMFAASTGFAVRARRGHLDLLLTAGPSRLEAAAAHLVMSTAPGIGIWLAVGLVEIASRPPGSVVLAGGSIAAMMLVSTLSWATTVPFPRLSGAIAWALVAVTMLAVLPEAQLIAATGAPYPGFAATLVVLGCPVALAGRQLGFPDLLVIGSALAVAVCAVAAALAWMTRTDVALEAAQ